jgi:hypothetical protein
MKKIKFENENKEIIEGIVIGRRGSSFEVLTLNGGTITGDSSILWVKKKSIIEMKECVLVMDLK